MGFLTYRVRRLVFLFIITLLVVALLRLITSGNELVLLDRNQQLKAIERAIQYGNKNLRLGGGKDGCKRPRLEIFSKEMMQFVKDQPRIKCSGQEDWVSVRGSTAKITSEAKRKHGDIECSFTDVLRANDYTNHPGLTTTTHTEYNLEQSDFVRVRCASDSGKKWWSILAGVRHDQDVLDRTGWQFLPTDALKLNVLMFGFDSISHNTFLRKLPLSASVLKDRLHAIVLDGYNIVGDGTPQALIPILTGKTELELPDTRRRMGEKASYCNVYPFIWNEFKNNGYVTAYMEDTPSVGIFTYRLKGFNEEPTDHYMRSYFVEAEPDYKKFSNLCVGSIPRHKIMLNYARSMMEVYKERPKFIFGFHGEVSHDDYNLVGGADQDIADWLTGLHVDGYLNNTILIFMSDHGHRFASIRNTQQGKIEERLPWFSFVVPDWFKTVYPKAYWSLKANSKRLTTPFDIHATLHSVLHYSPIEKETNVADILAQRSLSLFHPIPEERTCADAYIEPHWCTCLDWEPVSVSDPTVHRLAKSFIHFINNYNNRYTSDCVELTISSIDWAAKLLPSDALRSFLRSADADGFVPHMGADFRITSVLYQLKVTAAPSQGVFEFSATHDVPADKFSFRIEDVSRINQYGSQARCVEDHLEHLRKYCYCKEDS